MSLVVGWLRAMQQSVYVMAETRFPLKVAVNVSRGEQTFPQIMADFSLFVH